MDDLDQKILEELSKNGRKTFSSIGKKFGVSIQTITRRYSEMKTNGTIALLAITINLEKIGFLGTAHLLIKTNTKESSTHIVEKISKTPNIITAVCTFGTYDVYAVLVFKEMNDFYESILKIKEIPSVLNVDFCIAVPGIQFFPPTTDRF